MGNHLYITVQPIVTGCSSELASIYYYKSLRLAIKWRPRHAFDRRPP